MFQKLTTSAFCVAAAVTFGAGSAQAVSMSDLLVGTTLVQGSVTFSDFTYTDIGGGFGDTAVNAADIDVTTSASAGTVSLNFSTDITLNIDEVMEIAGGFTATGFGGTTLNSIEFFISQASAGGAFSFIEFGSNSHTGDATVTEGSTSASFGQALAGLSSVMVDWDGQGEAGGDPSDFASLSNFGIRFGFSGPVVPPMPDVPLPASLPLLIVGLGGLGYLRRRR